MKWKTKEGKILDIVDMSEKHLINCIAMLRRREEVEDREAMCAAGYTGSGEGATYAADQAMDEAFSRACYYGDLARVMEHELASRKRA
jgi:hypothetical protein